MLNLLSWAVRLCVFVVLLVFALKNADYVAVDVLVAQWRLPLVVVVFVSFGLGVVVGVTSLLGRVFQVRRDNAKLRRSLKKSEAAEQSAAKQKTSKQPIETEQDGEALPAVTDRPRAEDASRAHALRHYPPEIAGV